MYITYSCNIIFTYRFKPIGGAEKLNISYDYYKTFYYVAKYGSISQAAKLLLNNQPNLTRTVKKTLKASSAVRCFCEQIAE